MQVTYDDDLLLTMGVNEDALLLALTAEHVKINAGEGTKYSCARYYNHGRKIANMAYMKGAVTALRKYLRNYQKKESKLTAAMKYLEK